MTRITRTEAAQILRVSFQAVDNAIKAGRLSAIHTVDGRVLIESTTMRDEWARNTQKRIGVGPSPAPEPRSPLRSREERMTTRNNNTQSRNGSTNEAIPDYNDSRARTEHLKAELLELERKQKEGLLVLASEVEAKWVEIITLARTKILGIPTKAKQRIPDLDTDAIGLLEDIVRETLEDLSGEAEATEEDQ
jgi:hypothetical protein